MSSRGSSSSCELRWCPFEATPRFLAYARQHGKIDYHPVGTCKMGVDALAVVDPELKVPGVERLRVCDSSTMPRLVSSNTNAPTLMIGEKAADLIKGVFQRQVAAPRELQAAT